RHRLRLGSLRHDPGGAGRLDAGRRELALRRQHAAASRGRLTRMRGAAALYLCALLTAAAVPAVAADREHAGTAPMLFSSDAVQYDDELGLVVAKGHVEISQNDQTLLADTVTYNQRTDTITASGHVSLLQPTGDVVFADFVELHDDMREGFMRNL